MVSFYELPQPRNPLVQDLLTNTFAHAGTPLQTMDQPNWPGQCQIYTQI